MTTGIKLAYICRCEFSTYANDVCRPCYDRSRKPVCSCGNTMNIGAKSCWPCRVSKIHEKQLLQGPYRLRAAVKTKRATWTREWTRSNINSTLLTHARRRAKSCGVPCSITKADITVPELCPALGIPLIIGEAGPTDNSPTLDRVIPTMGYVPGNIAVISMRANRLKNDGTIEDFEKILCWLKEFEKFKTENNE